MDEAMKPLIAVIAIIMFVFLCVYGLNAYVCKDGSCRIWHDGCLLQNECESLGYSYYDVLAKHYSRSTTYHYFCVSSNGDYYKMSLGRPSDLHDKYPECLY